LAGTLENLVPCEKLSTLDLSNNIGIFGRLPPELNERWIKGKLALVTMGTRIGEDENGRPVTPEAGKEPRALLQKGAVARPGSRGWFDRKPRAIVPRITSLEERAERAKAQQEKAMEQNIKAMAQQEKLMASMGISFTPIQIQPQQAPKQLRPQQLKPQQLKQQQLQQQRFQQKSPQKNSPVSTKRTKLIPKRDGGTLKKDLVIEEIGD